MPAFMNVEDNATGEDGVDYTGKPATPLMMGRLHVSWDNLQCNDHNEINTKKNLRGIILGKSEATTSKKVETRTGSFVSATMIFAAIDRTLAVSV